MSDDTAPVVRVFGHAHTDSTVQFGDRQIFVTPAVDAAEGGPLSAYFARFGRGERAALPAPYEEVWVVVSGRLRIRSGDEETFASAGELLHIPEDSAGEVEAVEDTMLAAVSVPAH